MVPGRHEIQLTVTGPAGEDSDTIVVWVIIDNDADGMDDEWEVSVGLDPTDGGDGSVDTDGDGVINAWEHQLGSHPGSIDSDGDGYADGVELAGGAEATDPDSIPSFLHGEPGIRAPVLTPEKAAEAAVAVTAPPVVSAVSDEEGGGSFPMAVVAGLVAASVALGAGAWRWRSRRS